VTSLGLTNLNSQKEQSLIAEEDITEPIKLPEIEIPIEPATNMTDVVETES